MRDDEGDLMPLSYTANPDTTMPSRRSRSFVDFVNTSKLILANGLNDLGKAFPHEPTFKRFCHNGIQTSVIDFILISEQFLPVTQKLEFLSNEHVSDHIPICLTLQLGPVMSNRMLKMSRKPKSSVDWHGLAAAALRVLSLPGEADHIPGGTVGSWRHPMAHAPAYDNISAGLPVGLVHSLTSITPLHLLKFSLPSVVSSLKAQFTTAGGKNGNNAILKLRLSFSDLKAKYHNCTVEAERKLIAARLRRTLSALKASEAEADLYSLLYAKKIGCKEFWSKFKPTGQFHKQLLTTEEITVYFEKVMGPPPLQQPAPRSIVELFRLNSPVFKAAHEPFVELELQQATNEISTASSSGPDRLPTEIYKALINSAEFRVIVLSCFNGFAVSGNIPVDWLLSKLVPIPKKGKPSAAENLRPISIMTPLMRILMKMICVRMSDYLPHSPLQFGFSPKKSCADALLVYSVAVESALVQSGVCYAVFLDLKAAFDSVNHAILFQLLHTSQVPAKLCALLQYIYEHSSCSVHSDGQSGRPFQIGRGVKQGDPLSGELFNFLLTGLHEHVSANRHAEIIMDGKKLFFIMYADDIVVLSRTAAHAQRTIMLVVQYLTFLGLKLNAAKCEAMVIVRKHPSRSPPSPPPLLVEEEPIKYVSEFKYLGAKVNNRNHYGTTRLAAIPLAKGAYAELFNNLLKSVKDPPVKLALELFGTFVKSVASTGHIISDQWLTPSKRLLKSEKMNQLLTQFMKRILTIRRTTSDAGVYFLLDQIPLTLQIAEMTIRYYQRTAAKEQSDLEHCALRQIFINKKYRGTIFIRFLKPVFNIFDSDLPEIAVQKILSLRTDCFLKEAREQFKTAVYTTAAASSKLTLLVKLSPPEGLPKWLAGNTAMPGRLSRTLTRALLSSHNLQVETSRWHKKSSRDQARTTRCRLCDSGLEDIEHMLCACSHFDGSRYDLVSSLDDCPLSPHESLLSCLFVALSSSDRVRCLAFAKFFHKVLSHPVLCIGSDS